MRRRSSTLFILLNVLVSLGVALGVIYLWNAQNPPQPPVQVYTVEVLITNTPDPNATVPVRIITATPLPGSIGALPTGILDTPSGPPATLPTLDATALSVDTTLQGTATALPQNCIPHVVQSGDTPFGIAQQYGASGFTLMEVNGLTDETATRLQVGDVLIVPLEGCPLTAAEVARPTEPPGAGAQSAESTTEAGPESTAEATVRPTLTLPPTAVNAQVEIVEVVGAGDVTAEGVVVRNLGNTINVTGWTLSDSAGNTYTFAERFLFSNALLTVFTRVGQDTPVALFWNRNAPLFSEPDTVLTLRDANGVVQSTYRVARPQSLP